MDLQNKQSLLQKYWNGETSPADEQMIRGLSRQHPELFSEEELKYFNGLRAMDDLHLDADFQNQVFEEIDSAAVVSLPERKTSYFYRIAVAVVLMAVCSWAGYQWNAAQTSSRFADAETEEAYQNAQKALALISTKMSKVKSLTTAFEKFESTQNKIKSSTQK